MFPFQGHHSRVICMIGLAQVSCQMPLLKQLGFELWTSHMVGDITTTKPPGAFSLTPMNLTCINASVYFSSLEDGHMKDTSAVRHTLNRALHHIYSIKKSFSFHWYATHFPSGTHLLHTPLRTHHTQSRRCGVYYSQWLEPSSFAVTLMN